MANSDKIYLIESLTKHKIWKDPKFWEAALVHMIREFQKCSGNLVQVGEYVQEKISELVIKIAQQLIGLK